MSSNVLNNPFVHIVVTAVLFALSWFITSGNPVLTLTVGSIAKGVYTWLASYAD
jgi:hypothetical protein